MKRIIGNTTSEKPGLDGAANPRTCLFCPAVLSTGNRTLEHVFPDWMLRHFRLGDHVIAPQAWHGGEKSSAPRRHPMAAFRLGGVCSACNNGWMSRLEQKVKPCLLSLSDGSRHLPDLSHNEQCTLSRWAIKTALVMHAASYTSPVIPRRLYGLLKQNPKDRPPGIGVVAMQTPDLADDILGLTALQSDRFLMLHRPSTPADFARWKISLRVGILQLLVTYCSNPSWTPVGWRNVHLALWPTTVDLYYSARLRRDLITTRKESGTALFHLSLGVSAGLTQQEIDLLSRPPLEQELERFFGTFAK